MCMCVCVINYSDIQPNPKEKDRLTGGGLGGTAEGKSL